jgi:hypothetical protein
VRSSSRNRRTCARRRVEALGPLSNEEAEWLRDLLADVDRLFGPEPPESLRAFTALSRMLEGLAVARRALAAHDRADPPAPQEDGELGGVWVWAQQMLQLGRSARADAERRLRDR